MSCAAIVLPVIKFLNNVFMDGWWLSDLTLLPSVANEDLVDTGKFHIKFYLLIFKVGKITLRLTIC